MPDGHAFLIRATSVEDALQAMHEAPTLRPIAGGTQLMAEQGLGVAQPNGYLTLRGIAPLREVVLDAGTLRIGALVTLRELQRVPELPDLLAQAVRALGTPQVRTRATVGGNIAQPRPDHTLPPCLIALDARVTIAGTTGDTDVSMADLSMADLAARGVPQGSLITRVDVALRDSSAVFARVGPRNGPCYATASLALVVDPSTQTVRTGLGGVGPHALGAPAADDIASRTIDWQNLTVTEALAEDYARAVQEAADPITDVTATAAYRHHALGVMARRSLIRACEGARA